VRRKQADPAAAQRSAALRKGWGDG